MCVEAGFTYKLVRFLASVHLLWILIMIIFIFIRWCHHYAWIGQNPMIAIERLHSWSNLIPSSTRAAWHTSQSNDMSIKLGIMFKVEFFSTDFGNYTNLNYFDFMIFISPSILIISFWKDIKLFMYVITPFITSQVHLPRCHIICTSYCRCTAMLALHPHGHGDIDLQVWTHNM